VGTARASLGKLPGDDRRRLCEHAAYVYRAGLNRPPANGTLP
jgi:hypothetical protein